MSYQVTAGAVTVETAINDDGARAYIDVPRGQQLPDDIPQEQVERLLTLGDIETAESTADGSEEPATDTPEESGSETPDEAEEAGTNDEASALEQLDKDELLKRAEAAGVEVDKRWSTKRIAAAIDGAGE